jgi:hypothetical protein
VDKAALIEEQASDVASYMDPSYYCLMAKPARWHREYMSMRSSFEISNQANNLMFYPVSRRMGKSTIVKITCCDRGSTS